MKKTRTFLALIACAAATSAQAQSTTPYSLAASIGSSQIGVDICESATSCTKNPVGFGLIGGMDLGAGLSAELSYRSFGQFKAAFAGTSAGVSYRGTTDQAAATFGISGAYTLPLGPKASLKGRLGWGQTSVKLNYDLNASVTALSFSQSTTTKLIAPLAGVELSYALSNGLALTASFDHTRGALKFFNATDMFNLNQYSVGARFSF